MADDKAPAVELSYDATVSRLKDIADEIRRVAGKDEVTEADEKYLTDLEDEFEQLDEHRKRRERKALVERVDVVTKRPLHAERGHTPRDLDDDPFGEPESVRDAGHFRNPWNIDEVRRIGSPAEIGSEYRARAMSAIEKMAGTNDRRREAMAQIIERWDTADGKLSRQALITSSPEYVRAFTKAAKGQQHLMTQSEREALDRAMSLTDNAGGYLVPFQLDPTVIITSDGSRNDFRRAARQVVATGDVWNGVSAGATAFSWDAEAAEVSDDASTFAQPSVPVYKGAGFVPISLEAMQDEANVAGEVGRLLAFGKDTLESQAFATGSGSAQPTGIITALTGGAQVVGSATTDTFAIADVYALDSALPARYRPGASWFANRAIYNLIRQFDTAGGAGLWERLGADVPPLLLGRNAYESEAMDGVINATADNLILVYGDFSNYVIADRIGTTVEFIPHLFATGNNRPSGQRGWYAYFRVGADSVNDGAFQLLNVT